MKTMVVLAVVSIGVLGAFFGNAHYDQKITTMAAQAETNVTSHETAEVKNEKERINNLDLNKNESVLDWLKYMSSQKNVLSLSILGSSVTAGSGATDSTHTWGSLLADYLSTQVDDVGQVSLINNGYAGYSTAALIKDLKIEEVIKSKPDVVLFELCLLNNVGQAIPLKQTYENIDLIVSRLKIELPDSLIILQTANPVPSNKPNQLGLTYSDYNQKVKQYVEGKNLNFIDTYELFKKEVISRKLDYLEILADGTHPNDTGYSIWFEILKENILKTTAN